tara:strand:- start:99 stop:533 length:435 start_codon:yes stop_codon:yes gene_type:complete
MSDILETFNHKDLLIKEYLNWYLLLRNDQVTIGSLVLIEKNFHKRLSNISDNSFVEFGKIVREIEKTLNNLFGYEKINYLVLMMKDKEVHYHIIPRYSEDQLFESVTFADEGWPNMPDLKNYNQIEMKLKLKLLESIKKELANS